MLKLIKLCLLSVLLYTHDAAFAGCSMPQAPMMPDGNTASEAEMRSSGITVRAYLAEIKDYRYCIKKELERKGEHPADADTKQWEIRHNQSVDQEQYVADMFNAQVRLFKVRQNPEGHNHPHKNHDHDDPHENNDDGNNHHPDTNTH